ncbi:MAG: hypothetical protein OQK48_05900 [Sulfurimonas sp.]|uniref:hypothetical protein n=1 Tax=Sulfurimonas sp. TaxID=2022749 RepID=UPI002617C7AD|nr:hypothetical protein [Sulfurimonas sp.]MCW8894663.1 hypothetical protein [Sulfurimonas sp.]MCW8954462.1 hypothetical protein [Sulfurimonas sp.]MCW9067106.1 hypothetical protein [Sulfurimonas sp.]
MVRKAASKLAFTMIELIFAIVVIAISVMSLPMMIQVTSQGVESNIVQEAIFAASAELMGATSYYWDDNSMQDMNISHLSRVIDISGDCNGDRLRNGHIAQPLHRRCLDSNTTGARNAPGGIVTDLNDAAITQSIFTDIGSAEGYKNNYTSTINVAPDGADANIKIITSTITDANGTTVVVLRAQSANVGEIDYYKRRF